MRARGRASPGLISPGRQVRVLGAQILVVLLSSSAVAQDAGVDDAPRIVRVTDDKYIVNHAAIQAIDTELGRLNRVEAEHKGEAWVKVVAVSAAVGLAVGLVAGFLAGGFVSGSSSQTATTQTSPSQPGS